jgi:hypothetical protein
LQLTQIDNQIERLSDTNSNIEYLIRQRKDLIAQFGVVGDGGSSGSVGDAIAQHELKENPHAQYALISALNVAVAALRAAINTKQAAGEYVSSAALSQVASNLQAAINGKQATGDYALNSALANYALNSVLSSVAASLQAAINTKQDAGNYALATTLDNAIASLQKGIDGRQPIGNYALQQALADAVSSLQTALNGKQPTGNYALQQSLTEAISNLQSAINSKQATGDYALNSALANYALNSVLSSVTASLQAAINTKQDVGNYALASALDNAIVSLQKGIDGKQPIGDYALVSALNSAIASLQTAINGKQNTGDYALNSALSSYVLTTALNSALAQRDAILVSLQTAINGKQDVGDYALNATLANYILATTFNQSVASLQTNINTKQPLGNYVLVPQVKLLLTTDLTLHISTTGNDGTGTGALANPYATLSAAWNYVTQRVEQAGYRVIFQLADGTYNLAASTPTLSGLNNIAIQGNPSNPGSVQFTCGASTLTFDNCRNITLNGIEFLSGGVNNVTFSNHTRALIQNCWFNGAASVAITAQRHAIVNLSTGIQIRGSAAYFVYANQLSFISFIGLALFNNLTFTYFVGSDQSRVEVSGTLTVNGTLMGSRGLIVNNGFVFNLSTLPVTLTAQVTARGGQFT